MICSCIRNNYDFRIDHTDCKSFLYQDVSDWMHEYDFPETYDVKITPPYGDPAVLAMSTVGVSIIREEDMGAPITDGIYCFQTNSCGVLYTRYKAITCLLDCRLDVFISRIAKQGKDNEVKHAHLIESYIRAVHYNAERGYKDEAQFYYDLAKKELDCFKCNC
jgi:hypothetical protein